MTFPTALIDHPDLTDMDVRMLLLFDQIGWREGDRDGRIHSTNADLASRLRKSAPAVRASIARIEAVNPPLILRSVSDRNTRVIRLVYDRFGSLEKNRTPTLTITPVEDACFQAGGMLENKQGDARFQASPPIIVFDIHPDHDRGGDARFQASPPGIDATAQVVATIPAVPTDLAGLLAWLPCIAGDDALFLARLLKVVPTWLGRLMAALPDLGEAGAVDWVQDVLVTGASKDDAISYGKRVLAGWVKAGKRPDPPMPPEPPEPGAVAVPRKTAAERRAALIAGFDIFKEAADGQAD